VSRVYDALRKLEEQGKESADGSLKATIVPSKFTEQLFSAPALQARVGPQSRLVVYSDRRSPGAERFRLIRMALRNFNAGKLQKVVLITSPLPRDGKSTVALNLATSLAEEGKVKVLLLEADLHRPSLLQHLGLDPVPGLAEILGGHAEPTTLVRRIEPLGFYLLPAGRPPDNPTELLQTERFSALLRDFRASFDWILIDCPPAFPLADVVALKAHADGVLLIARAGSTPREGVQEVIQLFKPGHVIGLILNVADEVNQLYSHYYYRQEHKAGSARTNARGEGNSSDAQGLHISRDP
jgi:capsular exopolysaccharide synthesis family protein